MALSIAEQARIRKVVAAADDAEADALLHSSIVALHRLWSEDLVLSSPSEPLSAPVEFLERLRLQRAVQYATFERHRESTVVREQCAVTLGYEIVVPTGNSPDAGRKIRRRYLNVFTLDRGEWRLTARQVSNASAD
jgi:hypothetical protein